MVVMDWWIDGDDNGHSDDNGDDYDDDDGLYNVDYVVDLYVVGIVDGWVEVSSDEVGVIGQPADEEQGNHSHHHLHHLG